MEQQGILYRQRRILKGKKVSEMRGKEGISLGTCRARASQASRLRVACASQLYSYLLRFHLTVLIIEGPQGVLQENKPITPKQGRYIGETGKESRRRIVLLQGPGLYRGGRETYKRLTKTTVRERKELKQSIKEHWETIYCNIILARLTLERYIRVKSIKAN